jgi:hypothetical protein
LWPISDKVSKLLKRAGFAKPALGMVFSGLLLFLSTAGASPSLHQLIHPDAGSPGHQCVISLLQSGHVNATVALAVFIPPGLYGVCSLLAETFRVPAFDYRFSPSRAPPFPFPPQD